jgi:hypothetical protein
VVDGASCSSPWFVWTPFRSRLVKSGLVYRRLWARRLQLIVGLIGGRMTGRKVER